MISFEIKRFIRNNDILFIILSILVILVFNYFLEYSFYRNGIDINTRMFNLYNSFSQFMFLVFSPITSSLISKDIENNSIYLYINNGISIKKYYFNRITIFTIIISIILFVILSLYGIILRFPFYKYIVIVTNIIIQWVYIMSLSGFISIILEKKSKASIVMILTWFIMSLVNLIPIDHIKGKLFLSDKNSYISYVLGNFLGLNTTNVNFKANINIDNDIFISIYFISILWIIIINIFSFNCIRKKYKNI